MRPSGVGRLLLLTAALSVVAGCRGLPLRRDRSVRGVVVPTASAQGAQAFRPDNRGDGRMARLRERRRSRHEGGSAAESAGGMAASGSMEQGGLQPREPMPDLTPVRTCQVHIDLGRVHASQKHYAEAASCFREALAACPAHGAEAAGLRALAHRKLATALDCQGKFDDAAPHYREAVRLAPDDARAWNDAGYSAYLQGRLTEAETSLRRAAKLAPDDARIANNLGLALAAIGKTDEGFETMARAAGPAAAHANLGYLLAATGQDAAARGRYESALAQRPDMELARTALTLLDDAPPIPDGLPGELAAGGAAFDADVTRTADGRIRDALLPRLPQ